MHSPHNADMLTQPQDALRFDRASKSALPDHSSSCLTKSVSVVNTLTAAKSSDCAPDAVDLSLTSGTVLLDALPRFECNSLDYPDAVPARLEQGSS